MKKEKIILDTDIGDDIDDAYALALVLKSENIELIGVTTVFRNTYLRAKIAKALMKTLQVDVKVYAGCEVPFIEPVHYFDYESIQGGLDAPCQYCDNMQNELVESLHAVDFIIKTVRNNPGEITVVGIGPLTNIAMAIRKAPDIVPLFKKIVLMSGHVPELKFKNDKTKYLSEWNIICDPEAARIVYTCGAEVYQVGLNVTLQCALTLQDVEKLKNKQKSTNMFLYQLTDVWSRKFDRTTLTMHDPLAISVVTNNFCIFKKEIIRVELASLNRGKTIVTDQGVIGTSEIYVAEAVDSCGFIQFLLDKIH